jgi:hypothetical protein
MICPGAVADAILRWLVIPYLTRVFLMLFHSNMLRSQTLGDVRMIRFPANNATRAIHESDYPTQTVPVHSQPMMRLWN